MENEKENGSPDCCKLNKRKGILQGIIYGTIPHAGCIAFIVFSLLGVTVLASLFRPLLAKAYFFYIMISLSLIFATFSALLYLRKNGGIRKAGEHKGYLGILYGSTIIVSLILYMVVFPLIANVSATGDVVSENLDYINIKVKIPCPGHAPLIISELEKLDGVESIKFSFPNKFNVGFDSNFVSKDQILQIDVFKEYAATLLSEEVEQVQKTEEYQSCCSGPSCGSAQTGVCGCGS